MTKLQRLIIKARLTLVILMLIQGLIRTLPFAIAGLLVLSMVSEGSDVPLWAKVALRCCFWVGMVAGFIKSFWPIQKWSLSAISKKLSSGGNLREDDVLIAADLEKPLMKGSSEELRLMALSEICEKLSQSSLMLLLPSWAWRKRGVGAVVSIGVGLVLFLFVPSVFPWSQTLVWPLFPKAESATDLTKITPNLNVFRLTLTPPAYTNKKPEQQTSPELRGLVGTQVQFEAECNRPLDRAWIHFSNGKSFEALIERKIFVQARFVLDFEGSYQVQLKPIEGPQAQAGPYPIYLLADEKPVIRLLSPEEDLLVGLENPIPLHFEATDDVGLAEILLEWEGSQKGDAVIGAYKPTKLQVFDTWEWDLRLADFKEGDVVRYRLVAIDGNTVTGPSKSESSWKILEVTSFRQSHEAMEQILDSWREEAIDLLADINVVKDKVEKSTGNVDSSLGDFSKVAEKSKALEKMLKKIVELMEKDPYADYSLWLEHEKIHENLLAMNNETVKQTSSALQTRNKEAATQGLEQMASELERMTALSENLSREQNARDMVDSAESLESLAESIQNKLNIGEDKEIQSLLKEAFKTLQEMAQMLQKTPQDLPEDFVNQDALKDMDLKTPADVLSQISEALKSGDRKKALELAKQMLAAARELKDQMAKAHDSYSEGMSNEGLMGQMKQQQGALDKIIEEQQNLLAKTQTLEAWRLNAQFEEQKKRLKQMEQEARVLSSTEVIAALENINVPFSPDDNNTLNQLSVQQTGLAGKLKVVKQKLDSLSQKTATLGSNTTLPLINAMSSMEQASQQLLSHSTQRAQTSEERALEHLQKAQQLLAEAQQMMGQMGQMQSKGRPGGVPVMRRGGSNAPHGNPTGHVRLPRVQDFKAPKAFREEVLESLREKYPKVYEDVIHRYYRKLTE